jgi:hypothetical protein
MMNRSAEISPCGRYRTRLDRWWGDGPRVGWFLCNPSTADAEEEDATLRKCIGFTARWGYNGLTVINPFDLRSTDPRALIIAQQPASPRNDGVALAVAGDVDRLIVGWGCETILRSMELRGHDPARLLRRIREVYPLLTVECLGRSKTGNPYHPLMLAWSTPRARFEVPA